MSKLGKVVRIHWEDAWSSGDYYTSKDIHEQGPFEGISVGICIRDNKSGVSIAREKFGERYRTVQHIPRAMIRKVVVLK